MLKGGWKGKTAGAMMMLTAVVGLVLGYAGYAGDMAMGVEQAVVMFLNGLGIFGIRAAIK